MIKLKQCKKCAFCWFLLHNNEHIVLTEFLTAEAPLTRLWANKSPDLIPAESCTVFTVTETLQGVQNWK